MVSAVRSTRPIVVVLVAAGLTMALATCSDGEHPGIDSGPGATGPSAGSARGEPAAPVKPGVTTGQNERPAGGKPSGSGTPSSILDVKGTVVRVDTAAGLITLEAPDAGYRVIEVTPSTEYRLSEGEAGQLADIVPGSVVVGTGSGDGRRLRSRLVTILTY